MKLEWIFAAVNLRYGDGQIPPIREMVGMERRLRIL